MTKQARRFSDRPPVRVAALAILLVILAFALGRCTASLFDGPVSDAQGAPEPRALPENVTKFHDASEGVTCWRVSFRATDAGGISCLPDQWLATARGSE